MSDPIYDHIDNVLEPRAFTPSPALVTSVEAYLESLKQPRVYFERSDDGAFYLTIGDKGVLIFQYAHINEAFDFVLPVQDIERQAAQA